jgi:hypothetical protein
MKPHLLSEGNFHENILHEFQSLTILFNEPDSSTDCEASNEAMIN